MEANYRGEMRPERELGHPPRQPGVRGCRDLPQVVRDSPGNHATLHSGLYLHAGDGT